MVLPAALAACLVVGGCGSTGGTTQAPGLPSVPGPSVEASASVEPSPQESAVVASQAPEQAGPVVGIVLPDAWAGSRWRDLDRPALEQAFAESGLVVDIRDAGGVPGRFPDLARELVGSGIRVLVVSSSDDASGAEAIAIAQQAGVPVIDLDHLTDGGRANFFVGPDPSASGQILGEALLRCMRDQGNENGPVALVNGPADDSTAVAMKQAYVPVLTSAGYQLLASEDAPGWSAASGGALFERALTVSNGNLVGVLAASEDLTGAVTSVLKRNDGTASVAGVGSSPAALQRVLLGEQCMTLLTSPVAEAKAVASLATAIVNGDGGAIAGLATGTLTDAGSQVAVPSVLLQPQAVFAPDLASVVEAGLVTAAVLCQSALAAQACARAGIAPSHGR